jgi:valyl-tRNA synthetase
MPFVTEALWRALTGAAGGRESLMVAAWPAARPELADPISERSFAVIQSLVTEVNRFRSQNSIAPSARFDIDIVSEDRELLEQQARLVAALAGLSGARCTDAIDERPGTSTIQFVSGQAQVELAGLIDVDAELARLDKELGKAEADLRRVDGKLSNASFVERAPAAVVDREREKRADIVLSIDQLRERVEALAALGR